MPAALVEDPEEDIQAAFNFSEDFVQSPSHKRASTTTFDLDGLLPAPGLRLHEDLSKGCGGQLWPAGIALAQYLLRYRREELRGKTMLSPLSPNNKSTPPTTTIAAVNNGSLPIHGPSDTSDTIPTHPGIILVADCVYFEPSFPLLTYTLQQMVGPETVVFFSFKKRRRADTRFLKMVRKVLDVREIRAKESNETTGGFDDVGGLRGDQRTTAQARLDLENWRRDGIFL
ncbi:MAG: Methyltransferase-like protein 21D [Sclerophora amabilis]|nr:MAG: Methyltransferase-like protein 21D [Sclerophora amabilis]